MTTRDDISVNFYASPRIATVASPSTSLSMQDWVDTARIEEEAFKGMAFEHLIDASGKQDLGGGVLVGITVANQNCQVAFEARTTPAQTGTVTTGSSAPVTGTITFIDTSATFVTNGVAPGSLVINFTDQSIADVVEVVSETELKTKVLVNGIGNTFDVADVYHVFNIVQCNVEGGNLVATDDLDQTISPILPTAFTQVVRTSSSSATLQELTEIRFATYQNAVWIDATSGNVGTSYPNGTPLQPVDNVPDAVTIASALGLKQIRVIGNITLDTGDNLPSYTIVGDSPEHTTITINAGADVTSAQIKMATVTGTLDGDAVLTDCHVLPPLSFVEGSVHDCLIEAGTITLGGSSDVNILNCWSGVAGTSTPIIDYNGSGRDLIIRNYSGGIEIRNKTGSDSVSVDLVSGQVVLDSTVTAGTLRIAGTGALTDNSTGTTVVSRDGLLNQTDITASIWGAATSSHSVAGSFGEFVQSKLLTVAKFLGLK